MNKALLHMHLAVVLWGFTGVLGVAISLEAPALVWWRMLLTAIFIAVIITWRKAWQPVPRRDVGRLALVGALIALHWVAFYGAIKVANASIALICLSTASVFTAVLDPLVNKTRWAPVELALGALAILGVALIYKGESGFGAGIVLGIIAAILSAVFTVLNKDIAARYRPRTMVFYEMAAGWLMVSLILFVFSHTGLDRYLSKDGISAGALQLWPPLSDWPYILILVLCCTVWAQSLALSALQKLSSFTVTLSVNLEPVYGILLAFLFYQENKLFGTWFYAGVGLIILSVMLQMLRIVRPRVRARGGLD